MKSIKITNIEKLNALLEGIDDIKKYDPPILEICKIIKSSFRQENQVEDLKFFQQGIDNYSNLEDLKDLFVKSKQYLMLIEYIKEHYKDDIQTDDQQDLIEVLKELSAIYRLKELELFEIVFNTIGESPTFSEIEKNIEKLKEENRKYITDREFKKPGIIKEVEEIEQEVSSNTKQSSKEKVLLDEASEKMSLSEKLQDSKLIEYNPPRLTKRIKNYIQKNSRFILASICISTAMVIFSIFHGVSLPIAGIMVCSLLYLLATAVKRNYLNRKYYKKYLEDYGAIINNSKLLDQEKEKLCIELNKKWNKLDKRLLRGIDTFKAPVFAAILLIPCFGLANFLAVLPNLFGIKVLTHGLMFSSYGGNLISSGFKSLLTSAILLATLYNIDLHIGMTKHWCKKGFTSIKDRLQKRKNSKKQDIVKQDSLSIKSDESLSKTNSNNDLIGEDTILTSASKPKREFIKERNQLINSQKLINHINQCKSLENTRSFSPKNTCKQNFSI